MAQGEPPAALYDFLYKDSNRIVSYYAQLFGGRLSSLEETGAERSTSEKSAKLNAPIIGGELKSAEEITWA